MCRRFVQQRAEEIPGRFGAVLTVEAATALTPRYNVAPTQPIPVVVEPTRGERQVAVMRWGLVPWYGGRGSSTIFNARSETLLEKAGFRRLVPRQRCLVPADGFYEWEQAGGAKRPWLYRLAGEELFAFAGLYDRWIDEVGCEGLACTLLTTSPNALVRQVHGRTPVIPPREAEGAWLDPDLTEPHDLLPLLAPYPAERMACRVVSRSVNNGQVDAPSLLEPVAA